MERRRAKEENSTCEGLYSVMERRRGCSSNQLTKQNFLFGVFPTSIAHNLRLKEKLIAKQLSIVQDFADWKWLGNLIWYQNSEQPSRGLQAGEAHDLSPWNSSLQTISEDGKQSSLEISATACETLQTNEKITDNSTSNDENCSEMITEEEKRQPSEDMACVFQEQQTDDEKVIDDLRNQVVQLEAESLELQDKARETSRHTNEATKKRDRLRRDLIDNMAAMEYLSYLSNTENSSAQHELAKTQDSKKIAEWLENDLLHAKQRNSCLGHQNSNIQRRIEAKRNEIDILEAEKRGLGEELAYHYWKHKVTEKGQQKELESSKKRVNELVQSCKNMVTANKAEEEKMKKERQLELEELWRCREMKSAALRRKSFLQGQPRRMKQAVEVALSSLDDGLDKLASVVEEACGHVQIRLSALTDEIPAAKAMLSALLHEKQDLALENQELVMELLSKETLVLVLKEFVLMLGEKLMQALQEKLGEKEEEVLATIAGKEEAIRQLSNWKEYQCERYNQLYQEYSERTKWFRLLDWSSHSLF